MKNIDALVRKMQREGLPEAVIDVFVNFYLRFAGSPESVIPESDIVPVKPDGIEELSGLNRYAHEGEKALAGLAVIKLNGGLGTTMGLQKPKSLIRVKNGLSFLDITARRISCESTQLGLPIPLLFMNSFFTDAATRAILAEIRDLPADTVQCFVQNKFPKILKATLEAASWPQDTSYEWYPAGHGNLFLSLSLSGMLDQLLKKGYSYCFISNIDNLGAEIDPSILGYCVANHFDFLMEVTDRTVMDRKGGHLARLKNGRLALREAVQCAPADAGYFSDIARHRFFNTNNLWISCDAIKHLVRRENAAALNSMPFIINRKTIVPQDPASPAVYQLESAIGSAISVFKKSAALRVPRSRFVPVKNCEELLLIRSDRFILQPDYRLCANHAVKSAGVSLNLDPEFYSRIDLLESHFPFGAPSLVDCESLSIKGDVKFGRAITVRGAAAIVNTADTQAIIKDNTAITGDLDFRPQ